jgi:hypothetical protein
MCCAACVFSNTIAILNSSSMGRLNGGGSTTKKRPGAAPSSMIGMQRRSPATPDVSLTTRWAKRKRLSIKLRPEVHTPGHEWDNAWASTTTAPNGLSVLLNAGGSKSVPLPRLNHHSPRLGLQKSNRLRLPKPPSFPSSTTMSSTIDTSSKNNIWMPSGRRRVRVSTKKQRKERAKTKKPDNSGNRHDHRGWTPPSKSKVRSVSHHSDFGQAEEVIVQVQVSDQKYKFGPPLPLHLKIEDTTALQVKDLERVKNQLRSIFVVIETTTKRLIALRNTLGVKKDPTAMTTQQRIDLAKLSTEVERRTKECDTLTRENEQIKLQINDHRLMIGNTKRGIHINSKHLSRLKESMENMLKKNLLIKNERLVRTMENMTRKEEKEEEKAEKEILRLSERLYHLKRTLKLQIPTVNASPRASIFEYQQAAIDAAAMAGNIAMMVDDVENDGKNEKDVLLDEFSSSVKISSHQKAEDALKEAEAQIKRKLSPIKLKKLGAFAKYAHEEQTGAFTMVDKRKILSKTAKMNWKIAKYLIRKRNHEKIEHHNKLIWKRITHHNPNIVNITQFVNAYLIQERKQKSKIEMIEQNNKLLNSINLENTAIKNILDNDEKLYKETRMKNSNDIAKWKLEIRTENVNKIKYAKEREHIHETIKMLKPSLDHLMSVVAQYDEEGCTIVKEMNEISGAGHDHQIHTSMGFIEATIDSMLLIKAKKKADEKQKRKQKKGISSGRIFSEKHTYHTGGIHSQQSHRNYDDNQSHQSYHYTTSAPTGANRSRKGGVTAVDYEIDHLMPTTYTVTGHSYDKVQSTKDEYLPYMQYLSQPNLKYFLSIEQFNTEQHITVPLNLQYQIACRQVFTDNLAIITKSSGSSGSGSSGSGSGNGGKHIGAGTKQIRSYPNPADYPRDRSVEDEAIILHAPKVKHSEGANYETMKYISEWRIRHQDQFLL